MSSMNRPRAARIDIRGRLNAVAVVLGLAGGLLLARALQLQIVDTSFYQEQGQERFLREVPIPAYRGAVLDRNGEPLAISTPVVSIWAHPKELLAARERLGELARVLGIGADALLQKLIERQTKEFTYLKRQLTPEQAQEILALELPGVYSQREFRRFYPGGEVLAHVLGFTNVDDHGQEGLELAYDEWLAGKPGSKRIIQDRRGRQVETVEEVAAAEPGRDLILSIDRRLQYLAYRELKSAILEHNASSGSVVVLDVATGEVLAMVNQPSYNPNSRIAVRTSSMRNRAMTDVFEPGSTAKAFTVAAALELGKVTPQSILETWPGTLQVPGKLVTDIRNFGSIDVTHVLTKSSNVGATLLAQMLPNEHQYDMLHRFGFGQPSGSGFPGESPGYVPDWRGWRPVEKATLSYGYGLNVTALQLAQAYAAIGNQGRIRTPSFVKDAHYPDTAVIDPALARTLTAMLETVTGPEGSARAARIAGFRVAGKTGTSRKASATGYQKRYISLFAGLAPASHPRLATVIVVNDPLGDQYYGGLIAAPVFSKVVGGALRLLGEAPDAMPEDAAAFANYDPVAAAAEVVADPVLQ
jgi:cell division protein FtsI (penicillin-binding protein 3)